MSEYNWAVKDLSENAIDALAGHHRLHVGPGGRALIAEGLTEQEAILAQTDIAFAQHNPNLPIENVCSRLDNYAPQNPSQELLLAAAQKLAYYRNPTRLAGFIACGEAGLGKTHIAVGVAKAAMATGQRVFYINAPSSSIGSRMALTRAKEADIVIVDDFNNAFESTFGATHACSLLTHMHNHGGGKLMITSNAASPEIFLDKILLPRDINERIRIKDRVASALLGLTIEGVSYRLQNNANQKPWWEE